MYKKPFRYEEEDQRIVDADGNEICMIRGWSYLYKQYGVTASLVQDHYGELIAHLLNQSIASNLPPNPESNQKHAD